jgi:hypothetical protein
MIGRLYQCIIRVLHLILYELHSALLEQISRYPHCIPIKYVGVEFHSHPANHLQLLIHAPGGSNSPQKFVVIKHSRSTQTSVNISASAFAGGKVFVGCSIIRALNLPFRNL